MSLSNSVQYLKGVGPAKAQLLDRLGISTIEDLLYFFPNRYEDRTQLTLISDLKMGEVQSVYGEILVKGIRRMRNRRQIFEMAIGDESSRIFAVFFNQSYLDKYFRVGQKVVCYGRVEVFNKKIQMVNPEFEVLTGKDDSQNIGRIVPIYPLTQGITQNYLRKLVRLALDESVAELVDALLSVDLTHLKLLPIAQAIKQMHSPDSFKAQEKAYARVVFEEFFFFQLAVILRRSLVKKNTGISHQMHPDLLDDFYQLFPFTLTDAQQKVIGQVSNDLSSRKPMLRLVQGDVGSGKTAVSFFGCFVAFSQGFQSAIMAPTDILAEQHYQNLCKLIKGSSFKHMKVAYLNSSATKKERDQILKDVKSGKVHCLVGTHALIQGDVEFNHLSYVVIDEQHKFGVRQRVLLSSKGKSPDVLVLTATPIPRTLCLTLYGDLDVSTIDQLPKGRGKIKTYVFDDNQSSGVYQKIADLVSKKTQAYIIYPLVGESEKLDLKSATDMFNQFCNNEFKDFKLGLVHGQMKKDEVKKIMKDFKAHKIDILVSTTVLEVGVDVPNANVMLIEHADRFGLAQLHQLRGRIGRGKHDAVCILLADPKTEEGRARIEAIKSTTDGFKIAQQDLNIRGPGQYFGRQQHGMNDLNVINPMGQFDLLESARKEAINLMNEDSSLSLKKHGILNATIKKRYPKYMEYMSGG